MFAQCLQAFDEHSWAADDFLRANMSLLLRVMFVRVFTTLRGLFTSTLVAGAAGAVKDATLPMPLHWTDTQSSFRSPNEPKLPVQSQRSTMLSRRRGSKGKGLPIHFKSIVNFA